MDTLSRVSMVPGDTGDPSHLLVNTMETSITLLFTMMEDGQKVRAACCPTSLPFLPQVMRQRKTEMEPLLLTCQNTSNKLRN